MQQLLKTRFIMHLNLLRWRTPGQEFRKAASCCVRGSAIGKAGRNVCSVLNLASVPYIQSSLRSLVGCVLTGAG